MDHNHSNTIEDVRTPGRHLSLEERGMIQALHRKGYSLRSIAAEVNCAHTPPEVVRKNRRIKGRSIEERPAIVSEGTEIGHYEKLGTKIYFTHPYSSWERPQNERHNGLFRDFIPKGTSMEPFCNEDILNMADALNQRPRRILGYHTPMELFEAFLDEVYTIDNVS